MKNQKGQTAMEYLMTYGWAILIILVVGGVLYYYGVFSPSTLVGKSKTGFSSVQVADWQANNTGALKLMLENRVGADINITGVTVNEKSATCIDCDYTLSSGKRMNSFLTVTGTGLNGKSGDAYQADVKISYIRLDAPGTILSSSGTLAAKLA